MAGAAAAQLPFERRTLFTFSGPVAIPGVTLPSGQYLFRLASTTRRDVVQVLSGDGKTPYAMFFALPAQRQDVPANPEIRFMETAAGMPAAVRTWWYPGDRTGWEFVYPKEQARLLAKGTGQPVLTTVAETTKPPEAPVEVTRITPSGEQAPAAPEYVPAPYTGPTLEGEIAAYGTPGPAALPKTASPIGRIALGGFTLLLGAALMRAWRVVHT
jgi:hypothetical protein